MKDKLRIGEMIQALRKDMEAFPDHRRGHNRQYEVRTQAWRHFQFSLPNQPLFRSINARSTC